jgi:ubiquinone/menaquinone biosynthesis C-methylase UbiE
MAMASTQSVMNRSIDVRRQYSDDKNLATRIKLHAKHSTNRQGFVPWLFERYRFSRDDSILELGCGNGGQWEGRIENLPIGCRLVLSDYSEGMVGIAEERFAGKSHTISFRQIDIQSIPFEDEAFNTVIANHMLYHVPDLDKALSEVRRVLKAGGSFYAATNGNGGMRPYLYDVLKKFDTDTKAFTQELPFSLQNGGDILARHFNSVESVSYMDSLSITDTRDLIDWIKSVISITGFAEENFSGLYDYFEAIRIKEGAINIPKDTGLFICVK